MSKIAMFKAAVALSLALVVAQAPAAIAQELPAPVGEVILTIDGSIKPAGGAASVSLDLDGLKTLPSETFETTTIWTEGTLKFTGVALRDLLDLVGAEGDTVVAEALNGYAVEIPISDLEAKVPVVAYLIDDEPFSRRDKGPLWIVYPYDLDASYKSEVAYAYSIWQLQRLTVK